jgi:hypothetical protein
VSLGVILGHTLIWDKEGHPAWGIVHLIDEIQDQAVAKNGFPEKEVFG